MNNDFYNIEGYQFILKHPAKIEDVLNPIVKKDIRRLRDENNGDLYFLVKLTEEKPKVGEE